MEPPSWYYGLMMDSKNGRKRHFFADCPNFNWRDPVQKRLDSVVPDVTLVTCGQCKGRILGVLRDKDWSELQSDECAVIAVAAAKLRKHG